MPPFNFGQTFNQSLQSSLNRAQQRRAQEASRQLRLKRLRQQAEQARKDRQMQRRQFAERQDTTERRLDLQEEQQEFNREQQVAQSMQQMFQNAQQARFRDRQLDIRRDRVDAQIEQMRNSGQGKSRLGAQTRVLAARGASGLPTRMPFQKDERTDVSQIERTAEQFGRSFQALQSAATRAPALGADQRPFVQERVRTGVQRGAQRINQFASGLQREIEKRKEALTATEGGSGIRQSVMGMRVGGNRGTTALTDPEERDQLAVEISRLQQLQKRLQPLASTAESIMQGIPGGNDSPTRAGQIQQTIFSRFQEKGLPEDTDALLELLEQSRKAQNE